MNNIEENHLLRLALKYEKDALSEDDKFFALLKRWSALEFIADEYSSEKSKGEKILNKNEIKSITIFIENMINDKHKISVTNQIRSKINNSISQINYDNAKEKMRNLLRWADYPIKIINKNNNDIIDLVYQYRNCVVHRGGCIKLKTKDKKCNGPIYCRESDVKLSELNSEMSKIITKIMGKLLDIDIEFHKEIPDHLKSSS